MRVLSRPADRFQQALEGQPASDAETRALVATSRRLGALGAAAPPPDAAFVTSLRERLMAEAATLPTPSPASARAAAARSAAGGRAAGPGAPVVVVVGRGFPRLLAGAVASALLVCGVVGVASRGSVPGDALYPVKGWLDSVAVRMADSDLDRGRTQLAQAQEHISDARQLTGRRDPSVADVNEALRSAVDSVRAGQRSLDAAWAQTGNPQALLAMRDFSARALPQVEALRTEVTARSMPLVGELEALLHDAQATTSRRLAACGAPCSGAVSQSAPGGVSVPTTAATGGPASAAPSPRTTAGPGAVTVPGGAVTGPAGGSSVPAPGAGVGGGGASVGAGGGGASLSTDSASVGLPTVSGTVPLLPSATATVPLPTVSAGTGGAGATLPSATLGPVTLPGPTITLP